MGAPLGNKNALGNSGGVGGPAKYKPEYAEMAFNMCLLLKATDADLARVFDVSETTINRWKDEHVEFLEALKKGKDAADAQVARSLFERANGYSHPAVKILSTPDGIQTVDYIEHYPPDATSMIFWLKNRQPKVWRDKQVLEVEDADKVLAEVLGVDEKELPE